MKILTLIQEYANQYWYHRSSTTIISSKDLQTKHIFGIIIIAMICTTAAIQIKGTTQWLYYIDKEYQQSQQNMVVTPHWVSKVG